MSRSRGYSSPHREPPATAQSSWGTTRFASWELERSRAACWRSESSRAAGLRERRARDRPLAKNRSSGRPERDSARGGDWARVRVRVRDRVGGRTIASIPVGPSPRPPSLPCGAAPRRPEAPPPPPRPGHSTQSSARRHVRHLCLRRPSRHHPRPGPRPRGPPGTQGERRRTGNERSVPRVRTSEACVFIGYERITSTIIGFGAPSVVPVAARRAGRASPTRPAPTGRGSPRPAAREAPSERNGRLRVP